MKIVVAMSGGVDSSVTAALLKEQGHEVIGVHMKLHDASPGAAATGRCCGQEDALDARRVADTLGIPFYVMNLKDAFQKAVVDEFVGSYKAGRTPIPCIQCNGILKFRVLLARAKALGAGKLATGHYAQIIDGKLHTPVDKSKDQTYFLFPMRQAAIEQTLFPLGGMTKTEVREHARRFGLITAEKPESMEVCFIPTGDHAQFIEDNLPDDCSGDIVDTDGNILGHHDAYYRFTIGQRRGLGIALGSAAYVVGINTDKNQVVVSVDRSKLEDTGLIAHQANWFNRPDPGQTVYARIRHRGPLAPCTVGTGDEFEVQFSDPVWAASPGQAVVFYQDNGTVLGGAWIKSRI